MTSQLPEAIRQQLADLALELDDHSHGTIACEVLRTLVAISQSNADSGDWELINGTLADMAEALEVFQPPPPDPQGGDLWFGADTGRRPGVCTCSGCGRPGCGLRL